MQAKDGNQEPSEFDLRQECRRIAEQAQVAAHQLLGIRGEQVNRWLRQAAGQLLDESRRVIQANEQDLGQADELGLSAAQIDRLRLDEQRLQSMAQGLEQVAALESPVGEIFESTRRPNGLLVNKVRVPLGVIFFIYESRPNVTADAAAISVKSGNAVILRGGKEAARSSRAIVDILQECAAEQGIPANAIQLIGTPDRRVVDEMIRLDKLIDLTIPRGGESLIRRVSEQATMPVMKHFAGNCHVFVDEFADQHKALSIVVNSKCHRLGVCNAAESLLVHEAIADSFLPGLLAELHRNGIEIRGDEKVCQLDPRARLATEEDYATEFLDAVLSVACVPSVSAAIEHVNRYGSGHTDAIVSENAGSIAMFAEQVDSAAVMINASTRFNDGGEFGLGAEIGISTDKFHARGPCGLKELTTYKYVCLGSGQIR